MSLRSATWQKNRPPYRCHWSNYMDSVEPNYMDSVATEIVCSHRWTENSASGLHLLVHSTFRIQILRLDCTRRISEFTLISLHAK